MMPFTTMSRALLLAGVALFPASAWAQVADTTAPAAQQPVDPSVPAAEAASDQADTASTQIVVTGSRIAKPDYEAPNPIVSFNSSNIAQSGNTNLTNFLERVPR